MEEKIEFYGYTPEKMALATDFIKDGVNNKSIDSIVETFNKLFDRNDKPGKCSSCSAKRFRMLIVNFVKQGRIIWDRYNLYDKVVSIENPDVSKTFVIENSDVSKTFVIENVATDEDIDSLFAAKEETKEETKELKQTKEQKQTKESKKNKTNEKSK